MPRRKTTKKEEPTPEPAPEPAPTPEATDTSVQGEDRTEEIEPSIEPPVEPAPPAPPTTPEPAPEPAPEPSLLIKRLPTVQLCVADIAHLENRMAVISLNSAMIGSLFTVALFGLRRVIRELIARFLSNA